MKKKVKPETRVQLQTSDVFVLPDSGSALFKCLVCGYIANRKTFGAAQKAETKHNTELGHTASYVAYVE